MRAVATANDLVGLTPCHLYHLRGHSGLDPAIQHGLPHFERPRFVGFAAVFDPAELRTRAAGEEAGGKAEQAREAAGGVHDGGN
jgi:hypothetical protein